MLQAILPMMCFQMVVEPLLQSYFGEKEILKTSATEAAIAGILTVGSFAFGNKFEGISKGLNFMASTAFFSSIASLFRGGLNEVKDCVEAKLEEYGYDEWSDVVNPLIDISGAFALRKAAGVVAEYNIKNPWASSCGTTAQIPLSSTTNGFNSSAETNIFWRGVGYLSDGLSGIGKVFNGIMSFGKSNDYAKGNLISDTLEATGMLTMFNGFVSLAGGIWNHITGGNKINNISIYDIKKILKASTKEAMDSETIKVASQEMFGQLQQVAQYKAQMSNLGLSNKVDQIGVVSGIYHRLYDDALKANYQTALATNPELQEKILNLIDGEIEFMIVSKLLQARQMQAQIHDFASYGITVGDKQNLKATVLNNLDMQTKFMSATQDEAQAYKNLFLGAELIQSEYMECIKALSVMQNDVSEVNAPDFF